MFGEGFIEGDGCRSEEVEAAMIKKFRVIFMLLVLMAQNMGIAPLIARPARASTDFFAFLPVIQSRFSFKKQLFGLPSTLSAGVVDQNDATGWVQINGVDSQQPGTPFTWSWGDGAVEEGWFPMEHTYLDRTRDYTIRITAHYSGGGTDTTEVLVQFIPVTVTPRSLPASLAVTIPNSLPVLTTRLYGVPELKTFDDSFFTTTPRATIEYVLSVAAWIQDDFTNGAEYHWNNAFQQVVLRDANFGGMYSLWYTNPVSFASGDYGFQGTVGYSSFFHEMGHNFTLNSPGNYYYGGKIDGNANAIFSETMANIYAHATAYEILSRPAYYGIGPDLAALIKQSSIQSMLVIRNSFDRYLNSGQPFHSWNDPATPQDETFETFMTIAYQFCANAETYGTGYRAPLKRMLALLAKFDPEWQASYDPTHHTAQADTFRATLMAAAMSYGFNMDLREVFRNLNFPISDDIYDSLLARMTQ